MVAVGRGYIQATEVTGALIPLDACLRYAGYVSFVICVICICLAELTSNTNMIEVTYHYVLTDPNLDYLCADLS